MKNTFKLSIFFFHSVYKTNIECFLFGAQFKIIGPRWCQNHDYALSFALGIVMVLTSPRAYNFNCAPQSSQYLYIMYTKYFIYRCKFQDKKPHVNGLKSFIKSQREIEYCIAKKKGKLSRPFF